MRLLASLSAKLPRLNLLFQTKNNEISTIRP